MYRDARSTKLKISLIYVIFQTLDGQDRPRESGEEADVTSPADTAIASTSRHGVGIDSAIHQEGEVPSTSGQNDAAASTSPSEQDDTSSSVDHDFEMDVEEQDELDEQYEQEE
jgi:hypothetical protein